jgi:acyl-coenzyme A synthetase/AMP-(fatty) acid ligase
MQPQIIELVEELPKNANGKLDRSLLVQQNQNRFTAPLQSQGTL